MDRTKRLKAISEAPCKAAKAVQNPNVSMERLSLSSVPAELQVTIVRQLPLTSLATICQLNKSWHSVGSDELLQRMLPIPLSETEADGYDPRDDLLKRAIPHLIDINNVDALQRLLDFRPEHPYFRSRTASLLLAEPASLRARVTMAEEERFCLVGHLSFTICAGQAAVTTAFKYNDMSCMQLLVDRGLADYSSLLDEAIDDSDRTDPYRDHQWVARPLPGLQSRGGHNVVLNWLLAYPPRHVVQAMLVMWGGMPLHLRLWPLCDWRLPGRRYRDSMLVVAAGRGHPASLQTVDELRMMVEILTDDVSGCIIPEACQPLSGALRVARGIATMWPGTPPLVAEYLQSVCTWVDHLSSSSSNSNNSPPQPTPLPPLDPVLHYFIDLQTYDEMLEPKKWLELQRARSDHAPLIWLVSTEFLADEEAARRMHCFQRSLQSLPSEARFTYGLLHAAGSFRRWHCVEVVLGALGGRWGGGYTCYGSPEPVLNCAILDAVHGEPGCADGRIIRKLLRNDARDLKDLKCFQVYENMPIDSPFRGGWFGWEPFRLAFVESQQDREHRETPACKEMRDAVLDCLSISDRDALQFLVGEPSKALYRACALRRLSDKPERSSSAGGQDVEFKEKEKVEEKEDVKQKGKPR